MLCFHFHLSQDILCIISFLFIFFLISSHWLLQSVFFPNKFLNFPVFLVLLISSFTLLYLEKNAWYDVNLLHLLRFVLWPMIYPGNSCMPAKKKMCIQLLLDRTVYVKFLHNKENNWKKGQFKEWKKYLQFIW